MVLLGRRQGARQASLFGTLCRDHGNDGVWVRSRLKERGMHVAAGFVSAGCSSLERGLVTCALVIEAAVRSHRANVIAGLCAGRLNEISI